MCFIGLPFSYFYAQSVQEAEEECEAMNGIDSPSESSEEDQDVEQDTKPKVKKTK
jgi:hypothetical protein